MASKLRQLQSKACQASQFVTKHTDVYYKQLLEQKKEYIQHPPTVEKCNLLAKQLFFTRLARCVIVPSVILRAGGLLGHNLLTLRSQGIPGRCETFRKEVDYVKQLWKNKQDLVVEDAYIAALFGVECFAWFCAGEIVGRGFTFTGYYV